VWQVAPDNQKCFFEFGDCCRLCFKPSTLHPTRDSGTGFRSGEMVEFGGHRPLVLCDKIWTVGPQPLAAGAPSILLKERGGQHFKMDFGQASLVDLIFCPFWKLLQVLLMLKKMLMPYLDLAKAFDKVPHKRLLLKLEAHCIGGLVSNWIKSWLADRRQRVIVDGLHSQWKEVWSGVPQGSVLGPVLFLIYINDLDRDIASRVLKFADDTKLYCPVNNHVDSIRLQKDLDTVVEWASCWQMQFNAKKCKVVHFGKENLGFTYSMEGHCLENVDCEKNLDVVMSKDLKVARQCQESYSKANRMLGQINRTIKYTNQEVLMNLYKSMVRPHLEYCSTVWSPHYLKDKQMLEKVRFTRMFTHLKKLPYEVRLEEMDCGRLRRGETEQTLYTVSQKKTVPLLFLL